MRQQCPDWAVDGRDWPNREASRFVRSGGLTWHIQEMGSGPSLLLLHGTGASAHSFRDLGPLLARRFRVLQFDLPGHGFTEAPPSRDLSLQGMSRSVAGLLETLDIQPELAVGHSAGAAIAIAMTLDGKLAPRGIVAINGALRPIAGAHVFSPLAKLMSMNPLVSRVFAWRAADPAAIRRLLEGTGSSMDARGIDLYARLFRRSGHVGATLGMMANWNLNGMQARLRLLTTPLLLLASTADRAVPPDDADRVAAVAPAARANRLPYGGHLVHEEFPDRVAALVAAFGTETRVLGD